MLVKVLPNVLTGLYNNNSEVINEAKLPEDICPDVINFVPNQRTIAIPIEAIKYIKGDIQPERFIRCIETLNDSLISCSNFPDCLSCKE